ncbi:amidohydrolase [Halioglobus japonicus]|uniref:Imidazolonepropionase n=1 Tax=Halioglobus japonicus TaxID=930805 RepID=A0AAP8MH16_9GAMM|nr:imidazolonepropionase [Halioglobus japonicus]PLW87746.1 imidazolonepropionase [Halioglobus japonicus]GHD06818.1 amidohydrolase [Halioglobus japonicus]
MNNAMRNILALAALSLASAAHAETVLIQNTTVDTMSDAGQLIQTDVLVVDGRVAAIGRDLDSTDARIIDGTDKRLTPGVFNAMTQMGVVEIDAVHETYDATAEGVDYSASLAIIDAFNPNSTVIPQNRIHGLTRALVAPSASDTLFAGQVSIVNLSGKSGGSIEQQSVGVLVNYNEYAKGVAGGSRAAALASIRRALNDAQHFADKRRQYAAGEGRELSLPADDLDALLPVLQGEEYLFVKVSRASDILKILEVGESYNLRMILVGAQEGWMVADAIAEAGTPVIIDPTENLPEQFQTLGARLENPALLHAAGVDIMFTGMGWQNTHNAYLVTQCAGVAVAHGLPYEAAMAALFSTPSTVFSLDNSGRIAADMPADMVLWSGDPLELVREAELVFVAGEQVPMVSRSTRLRDKYLAKNSEQD